jgi:hypothetical protein
MTVHLGDLILFLRDIGSSRSEDSSYHSYYNGQTYTVGKEITLALAQHLNGETPDHYWKDVFEFEGESPT